MNFLQISLIKMKKVLEKKELLCLFVKRNKKNYYSNINKKDVTDNKTFWKTVTPFTSDKVFSAETIDLVENDIILNNDFENSES